MRQTHAISGLSLHRYEKAIYAWLTTEPLTPERLRSPSQAADVLRHAARTHTQRLAGLRHGA
jgi:hypothetical protein